MITALADLCINICRLAGFPCAIMIEHRGREKTPARAIAARRHSVAPNKTLRKTG
jgi:hypothetical protein